MAIQLQVIKTGKREAEGNLYMFQDLQKNDMNYYDVNGMLIRTRKIRPEERQTTIFIGETDVEGGQRHTDEEIAAQETEDAVAVELVELPNADPNQLTPEEKEVIEAYVPEGAEPGPATLIAAMDAYMADVSQGVPEERKLVIIANIRQLEELLELQNNTTPGEDKTDEVVTKIKEQRQRKARITKKQQIADAAANALIPDSGDSEAGGPSDATDAGADEDFELE